MFKNLLITLVFSTVSFSSFANWVTGLGYMHLSDESDGIEVKLGGAYFSLGYKINSASGLLFIPEIKLGTGVTDDTVTVTGIDVDVELDRFVAISLRGQQELSNGLYLFAAPSYGNAKYTASASANGKTATISNDDWEFGVGGGLGYYFTSSTALELSYEQYDGADIVSADFRFNF